MIRRPIKEINAEFIAEEKYLDSIQRIVKEACAATGMSRRDVSAVQLAIEEGATNIIRHAYLYEKGTLRLRIIIYRKMIVFSLIDSGRSFHPKQQGAIDLEPRPVNFVPRPPDDPQYRPLRTGRHPAAAPPPV